MIVYHAVPKDHIHPDINANKDNRVISKMERREISEMNKHMNDPVFINMSDKEWDMHLNQTIGITPKPRRPKKC